MRGESRASACSLLTFSSAAVGRGEGEPAPSLQRREETAFSWWGREGFGFFFDAKQCGSGQRHFLTLPAGGEGLWVNANVLI